MTAPRGSYHRLHAARPRGARRGYTRYAMGIRGRFRWWHAALLAALGLVAIALVASWAIVRLYGPTFTRERVEALEQLA